MSDIERKLAVLETIEEIKPIKGADNIEAVRIRGWWCVAKKGEFQLGDKCVYFEIDSFLPVKAQYEFLRTSSYKVVGDSEGFRLKTVKLRGQISQGLVIKPEDLEEDLSGFVVGDDLTSTLGVIKYEPVIEDKELIKGTIPGRIQKTDEERIQNLADRLSTIDRNSRYVSTEKVDGKSTTYYHMNGEFGVCGRNIEYNETAKSPEWQFAYDKSLKQKLERFGNIAIQGELFGKGINKNIYKLDGKKFVVFSIQNLDDSTYYNYEQMEHICEEMGLEMVPVLDYDFKIPDTIEELLECANGKSVINPSTNREGVVIRNQDKTVSFKVISNAWLLKNE